MPASRVKERLISLMGTDVVKLNDRKYIDKLNARLEQEYQANCDKREEELAEAERQRMRKLIIDGVLKPEDLREEDRYLLQGKKSKKNDASNKKKKVKQSAPKARAESSRVRVRRATKSAPPTCGARQIKEKSTKVKYSDPKKPGTTPRPINGTTSLTETQMSRLRKLDEKSESGRTEDEREQNGQDEENDQPSQPAEDENAIVGTDEDNSEIQSSGQNFISSTSNKSEEPLLEELQKEETVAGLYKIAETLLPPK